MTLPKQIEQTTNICEECKKEVNYKLHEPFRAIKSLCDECFDNWIEADWNYNFGNYGF